MNEAAFRDAIVQEPENDLPRLVYADWLEETGDSLRAEFIRIQCELAHLSQTDPRYRLLEDREHQLLSENELHWRGDWTKHLIDYTWNRGFLSHVQLGDQFIYHPIAGFDADDNLITHVQLAPWGPRNLQHYNQFARSDLWSSLRHVNFDLCTLIPYVFHADIYPHIDHWIFPTEFDEGQAAEVMNLRDRPAGPLSLTIGAVSNATEFSRLFQKMHFESLGLSSASIDSQTLAMLFRRLDLKELHSLDISANPLSAEDYRTFTDTPSDFHLQSLDISSTPLAAISLAPLLQTPPLQTLTKLDISGCGSARWNMNALADSAYWHQAEELRVHSGTIPASTLEPLFTSIGSPNLQLLDLADNFLRSEGVERLCTCPWLANVTWLALSRNYLDDRACIALAESEFAGNLRTLHLAYNSTTWDDDELAITDVGVYIMSQSQNLKNLRLLTLNATRISDEAVRSIMTSPHWHLFGLGLSACSLSPELIEELARWPGLSRLIWLDLSHNPRLFGSALWPLAQSPYLSRLCELDIGGVAHIEPAVLEAFRVRLGRRLSY